MTFVLVVVLVLILICIRLYVSPPTKWCRSQRCLIGKTALITGANTGIGYETALDLAKRGAKVILGCRELKKGKEACRRIIEETDNQNVSVKLVDFSSFDSVRTFAQEMNKTEDRLDILVNNAGLAYAPDMKTKDGYDIVMQVNYFSHFLLTNLLIGLMAKSKDPSRIVNVSSLAAQYARNFDINDITKFSGHISIYSNSKLCNILFTKELAKKLQNTNITTYSVHPGAIKTDIFRTMRKSNYFKVLVEIVLTLFYKGVVDGAQTSIYCSVEKNIEHLNGHHFDNCRRVADYKTASDPQLALKLWELTEGIVQLRKEEKLILADS